MQNSYLPFKMKVVEIKNLSPDTKALKLEFVDKKEAKEFNFLPGQFVMLSLLGFGEVIIALTASVHDLPFVEVSVRSVGSTTKAIHRLKVGDEIGLRGPYGKGLPLEKIAGREVLLIAGGLGLAPLRSLINYVKNDHLSVGDLKIFVGAKTPNDLLYKNELKSWEKFAEVLISVNSADGDWKGHVGLITELFDHTKIEKDAIAILCGPPVMFKPTRENLKKFGLKDENIFMMFERRMKCGMGKCQHCTCGEKYICLDGPTFSYEEIKDNFEAFL